MDGLADQLHGEHVGRQGRHEQAAGDAGGGDGDPHEVGADAVHGGVVRPGLVEGRQMADDREDGATAAGGVGGREGRQQQIGPQHGVTEVEGAAAHELDQGQGDAPPQAGLGIGQGEHEGGEDQPDRGVGEPGQGPVEGRGGGVEAGPGQLLRAEQHEPGQQDGGGQAQQADGASGKRLQDQRHDHRCEQGEIMPGVRGQTGRGGDQRDGDADQWRKERFPRFHWDLPNGFMIQKMMTMRSI